MGFIGLGFLLFFGLTTSASATPETGVCVDALMRSAQAGDTAAFARLTRELESELYGFCLNRMRNREAAKDLVQDVFLQMFRKKHQCTHTVRGWMYTIARNRSINLLVKHPSGEDRRTHHPSSHRSAEDPAHILMGQEAVSLVREAIGQLSDLLQETATLFYMHHLSLKEIAEQMDAPVGTIKRRLYTVREILSKKLDGHFSQEDF